MLDPQGAPTQNKDVTRPDFPLKIHFTVRRFISWIPLGSRDHLAVVQATGDSDFQSTITHMNPFEAPTGIRQNPSRIVSGSVLAAMMFATLLLPAGAVDGTIADDASRQSAPTPSDEMAADLQARIKALDSAHVSRFLPYGLTDDLVKHRLTDDHDADKELKGQVVEWRVNVSDVRQEGATYRIHTLKGDWTVGVYTDLFPSNEADREAIEALKKGTPITIRGYIREVHASSVEISPAILVGGKNSVVAADRNVNTLDSATPSAQPEWKDVHDILRFGSDSTELQKEKAIANFSGKIIEWRIPVNEVVDLNGAFRMSLPMEHFTTNVYLVPRDEAEAKAIGSFKREGSMIIRGRIERVAVGLCQINPAVIITGRQRGNVGDPGQTNAPKTGMVPSEGGPNSEPRQPEADGGGQSDGSTASLDLVEVSRWDMIRVRQEINAIYARCGAEFADKEVQAWADSQPWYQRVPGRSVAVADGLLTGIQRSNVNLLAERRAAIKKESR